MSIEPSRSAEAAAAERSDRRTLRRVLLGGFCAAVAFLCLVPNNFGLLRLFSMPSQSMLPTLSVGNRMIVSRLSYGLSRRTFDQFDLPIAGRWPAWPVARGDLIVFRLTRDPSTFLVKRVIGLPGDRIELKAGVVLINGVAVPRRKVRTIQFENQSATVYEERLPEGVTYEVLDAVENGPFDNVGPYVVPAGHYFALGDNRDNSTDSREQSARYGVGYVSYELIQGRVVYVF